MIYKCFTQTAFVMFCLSQIFISYSEAVSNDFESRKWSLEADGSVNINQDLVNINVNNNENEHKNREMKALYNWKKAGKNYRYSKEYTAKIRTVLNSDGTLKRIHATGYLINLSTSGKVVEFVGRKTLFSSLRSPNYTFAVYWIYNSKLHRVNLNHDLVDNKRIVVNRNMVHSVVDHDLTEGLPESTLCAGGYRENTQYVIFPIPVKGFQNNKEFEMKFTVRVYQKKKNNGIVPLSTYRTCKQLGIIPAL